MKLDLKLLIATAVAGVLAFVIDQILYNVLVDTMPRPVLIAILIAVLAAVCCIVISVVVILTDSTQDEFLFLESRGAVWAGFGVCLVVLFLGSMLMEWLYDHEEIKTVSGTSYIFVLDESGSMSVNDPDYARYEAVKTVVNTMSADFPYAVYMFSDGCQMIRDMAPASDGGVTRPADADQTMMGGTCISNALQVVYSDLQSGQMDGGEYPQVILLTDGYASDMGFFIGKDILNSYKSDGIQVSTVGLGSVDESLLSEIADKTGGQYVRVDNASQLSQGFTNVTNQQAQRDLISTRKIAERNGLYLFLRIVFLTLIGVMVAFMKALVCADCDSTTMILAVGGAAGLVGALVMEFGLAVGLPAFVCRGVYWLLLALTPRMVEERVVRIGGNRSIKSADDILGGGISPVEW